MNECAWRPRPHPGGDYFRNWSGRHSTYGRPKLPYLRSSGGHRVHRIRCWSLGWARAPEGEGAALFTGATPMTWCGMNLSSSKTTHHVAADLRLLADSAGALCPRCFPCEVSESAFRAGSLIPGLDGVPIDVSVPA